MSTEECSAVHMVEKFTLFSQLVLVRLRSMFFFTAAERQYNIIDLVSHSNIVDSGDALFLYPNRVQTPLHLQL